MGTLADFYNLLKPELPGCPEPMIDIHLREVIRAFCQQTSAWRLPFDDVDLVAGQAAYDLDGPETDSELVRVIRVEIADSLLWEDTDLKQPGAESVRPKYERDDPPFTVNVDIDVITLMTDEVPTASLAGGLKMVGSFSPTRDCNTIPNFLRDQYGELIRIGVLARLMLMGNQPWTDRPLAAVYKTQWDSVSNFATYQAQVGNTQRHLRVKKWG